MNSFPTRFLCAVMSLAGTVGLVAFASPAVAVGGAAARAQTTIVATAAPASFAHNG